MITFLYNLYIFVTTPLGSIFKPYYIQSNVIMNHIIRRFQCTCKFVHLFTLSQHFILPFSVLQLCEDNWDENPEKRMSFEKILDKLNELFPIPGKLIYNTIELVRQLSWPRGFKSFLVLSSDEHEIGPPNESQITNNCRFVLAKNS